jgi:hypothetical protein
MPAMKTSLIQIDAGNENGEEDEEPTRKRRKTATHSKNTKGRQTKKTDKWKGKEIRELSRPPSEPYPALKSILVTVYYYWTPITGVKL